VLRQAPTTFAPGTYVVTATATAPDGLPGASPRVKFWVLGGARTELCGTLYCSASSTTS